jgi:hypothetical protein
VSAPAGGRRVLVWAFAVLLALVVLRGFLPPSQAPLLRLLCWSLVALGLGAAVAWRGEPEPAPVSRDPGAWVLAAALGVFLAALFSHDSRITSDGVNHFIYLRSLWIDRDLDFANDYAALSPLRESSDSTTPIGRTGNAHPVGPALLWSPFYLAADLVCRLTGRPADGQNVVYRNAVSIASVLYAWLGLLLLYRAAAARAGRVPALLAALGIGFATFLYWYIAYAPTMSHAVAFGVAGLFLWLWLQPWPDGPRRAAVLGAVCGLEALTRWPNVLIALLPAVESLPRWTKPGEWRALLRDAAVFVVAALAAFSPQMIVWKLLYGSLLTLPQGAGYISGAPAVGGVLFSPRHGLLSWSPLLYLGFVGLLLLWRREPWRAAGALVLCAALTAVNARVADWWGSSGFGARRFDLLLPVLGLGLAVCLAALAGLARRHPLLPAAALLAGFVLWNLAFTEQYREGTWDYGEPVAFEEAGRGVLSVVDRTVGSPFSLPAALVEWMRSGRPPADYESLYMERRYGRWSVRMGLDERMFLEDGWSALSEQDGLACRYLSGAGAGFVLPLHGPRPYHIGGRIRLAAGASPDLRLRIVVNQRPAGLLELTPAWADLGVDVPAEAFHPGRNSIRLRVVGPATVARAVAVAALWAEPAGGSVEP